VRVEPSGERYYQSERDKLLEVRLARIERDIASMVQSIDRLEMRINYLFGGLALLVAVANLAIPLFVHWITGGFE
jgi:hypothetical protein